MKLDIIYTYYNGFDLLDSYLYHWSNNFDNTKHDINFVIIDDHSTKKAIDVISNSSINCNLQVYYIEDNILWNEEGAKNLGVKQSSADVVLLLDWDCLIYEKLVQEILSWDFCNKFYQFYTLPDCHATKKSMKPINFNFKENKIEFHRHYAAVCMSREVFDKCGGFDEDFAGNYGYSDNLFVDNLRRHKVERRIINNNLLFLINKGETKNVYKFTTDRKTKKTKKENINWQLWQKNRSHAYLPKNPIRFNYKKVYERYI